MLEYIKGTVSENTPTHVVVETGAGLGYMLTISLASFEALQNCQGEIKILVHEVIREDTWTLYGFMTAREREMFRLLIGVSGVGPGTAILILSSITLPDLEVVITSGDHARLKNVKGIGSKTAQRIIVDLKDKIKPSDDTLSIQSSVSGSIVASAVHDEALAALLALGFGRPQSIKVLRRIFDTAPDIKVEAAIKQALSLM